MKNRLKHIGVQLDAARKASPLLFWLRAATIVGVAVLFVVQRNFWTPDTLFIVLLALFVVLGQARAFLLRFAPFLLLLLTYDSFRSIADQLNTHVHFTEMINFDRFITGGSLPTADLQNILWHGHVQWYDFYFYFLYTIHFLAPVLLAILLWKLRPKMYWSFVGALVGLSFAAFFTYVIFPAAPPWMASDLHYIAPIHHISSDVWSAMGVTNYSQVYAKLAPNAVAAVPSLHAAYPTLFVLFLISAFGWRRTWWTIIYPISIWVGVVYLGEHYVFDVILGIIYAVGIFALTKAYLAYRKHHPSPFKEHYHAGRQWAYAKVTTGRRTAANK